MCWQSLTFFGREFALAGVQDLEPAIVDLIAMHHADIFRASPVVYARCRHTLLQCRKAWNGAAMAQLLASGHPLAVFRGLSVQPTARISQCRQAGAAAVKIHLGPHDAVKQCLANLAGGNNGLRCLLGHRAAARVGSHGRRSEKCSGGKNSRNLHNHPRFFRIRPARRQNR